MFTNEEVKVRAEVHSFSESIASKDTSGEWSFA